MLGKNRYTNGATEFGEQYFTRAMLEGDYNPLNVDWADITNSTLFSKPTAMVLNSSFDYTGSNGFEVNSLEKTARNLFNRKAKSRAGNKFNKSISGPIGNLSKPLGVLN